MLATMSYSELKDFEKELLDQWTKIETLSPPEKRLLEANSILVSFRLRNLMNFEK